MLSPRPLSLLISALLAPVAFAADDNLDDIERIEIVGKMSLYSATKSDTPIMETARSITIETEQQLFEKGAVRLDDAFTYSAGVMGETYGFATRGDWVRIRGLVVPQYRDSLQSLFGNYNNPRPEVYTLEQVEALKGPASVLYGKGSPGGLINLVSKTPKADSQHELQLKYGSFDHKQLNADSTGAINDNWMYRMVGVYRDSDTQVDFVEDKTLALAPSITWMPNQDNVWTLLVNYTDTESDTAAQFLPIAGTLLPGPNGKTIDNSTYVGDPDYNQYDADTLAVTLIGEHYFNDNWSSSLTARYTDASADYQQAWISFIPPDRFVYSPIDGSLYKDGLTPRTFYRQDATSEQAAIDLRLRGDISLGNTDHQLLFGVQYQDVSLTDAGYYAFAVGLDFTGANIDDSYWINPFNPVYGNVPPQAQLDALYSQNPGSDSTDLGLYISDQISIGDWLITLGARFDDTETEIAGNKQSDDEVSLSAGLMYQFDFGLSPYINYAESFNPVIGDNGAGQALKPQRGEQIEVGLKYQPEFWPALVQLAWFDIKQTNLNDPQNLGSGTQNQLGEATITGIELEAIASLGDFTLEVNASSLDHEDENGVKLAAVPEEMASAWLSYQYKQFNSGLGIRYNGESYGGRAGSIYDDIRTPSYTLVDLMVSYQWDNIGLQLNARNLLDKEYYATCLARGDCFPGDEQTIVGTLTYAF